MTLKEIIETLDFNFRTIEDSVRTVGMHIIALVGIALIIYSYSHPLV